MIGERKNAGPPDPAVMEKLPNMCFAIKPGTENEVIGLKKGERGFWATKDMTPADVDFFNAKLGVSKAQVEAMLAGSLFGFDALGANPDNYKGKAFA